MVALDLALIILIFTLIVIGIVGAIVPGIPGPPIAWFAMLAGHFCSWTQTGWITIVITFILAVIVTVLDFVIQPWLAKTFGGSKACMWGATIGLIIGLLFAAEFIPLVILGPFLGALIGELIANPNDFKSALKASFGALTGFFLGTGIKLICCFVFFWIIIFEMIFHLA